MTQKDLIEENPMKLKTPFVLDLKGGVSFGSDMKGGVSLDSSFLVEGIFLGTELILELQGLLGQIPFHADFRPQSNSLMFDSLEKEWIKQEILEKQPLKKGEKFKLELKPTLEGFKLVLNGEDLHFFVSPVKIPAEEIVRLVVYCREEDQCVEITRVQALNIPDFTRISSKKKKPQLISQSQEKLRLFIGVMTSPQNRSKRDGVRQAWFQDKSILSGEVQARFFLGRSTSASLNEELLEEAKSEGDIVLIDYDEDYYSIANKTLEIMRYASTQVDTDFVMKCDDDTYVRVDRVLGLLEAEKPSNLYMGLISQGGSPIRDLNSKWYISPEMYPRPFFPPFAHGPGYVLSRDLAEFIVSENDNGHLSTLTLEDVGTGIWVDHGVKEHNLPVKLVDNRLFLTGGCRPNAIIGHYINPLTMRCMWEKYARGEANFCC